MHQVKKCPLLRGSSAPFLIQPLQLASDRYARRNVCPVSLIDDPRSPPYCALHKAENLWSRHDNNNLPTAAVVASSR